MSQQLDQQYKREDTLPDTPEQAIENWQTTSSSLAYIVPEVAAKLEETGALLYQAQEAARFRGDLGTVEQISIAYANIERMANQVVQLDSAKAAAGEVIKVMDGYLQQAVGEKQEVEQELGELVAAVEGADFSDPRIEAMAEMIETDLYEMISEQESYNDPSEDIYDNAISDMLKVIRQSSPNISYAIAERLFRTLLGEHKMNDIQRGLLLSLVNTIALDDKS